ncbi:four helix bundle protein [uncultured Aquimarina sp.]|uniref:four helix bundle protein n=1 Tax=uncultured Aquimarina sp. TaxID=575652 RepID=UPI00262B98A7|nr:four helix bundle protein [uncultured Aquimarina sp.]
MSGFGLTVILKWKREIVGMRDFKELKVWAKSHKLYLLIYGITNEFPNEEKFGVISQIRRASSSVPTNIAEGCGHDSNKEFARYLRIASASISEVEYLVILSADLNYVQEEQKIELMNQVISIKKMLYHLVKSIT